MRLSVIIPAHNASEHLPRALQALRQSLHTPHEVIVVDDGSTDTTQATAQSFGVTVLTTPQRCGPAFARNMAASRATGDVLFFLDSDVCVHADTLSLAATHLSNDPTLDAVIGSYDYDPACPAFLSQYRNLMHAYVHQTGSPQASTFWSGCGAIRRNVLLHHGGFSETYRRPAVEDIELGYRLRRDHRNILLDPLMLVTHLKRWTFLSILKTDIAHRGIPWTELILRDRRMPNDLNLQLAQRLSVAIALLFAASIGVLSFLRPELLPPSPLAVTGFAIGFAMLASLFALNHRFYAVLARKRGIAFMLRAVPFHFLYHFYCGFSFFAGASLYFARNLPLVTLDRSETASPNAPSTTEQGSTL